MSVVFTSEQTYLNSSRTGMRQLGKSGKTEQVMPKCHVKSSQGKSIQDNDYTGAEAWTVTRRKEGF